MIWLLIGYMWLFIHRPFEIWPVLGTLHVERFYMLGTIACWLAIGPGSLSRNRLHWYFIGFVMVMLLSWFLSPFQVDRADTVVADYLKYCVFYLLLVTSIRTEQDLRSVLVGHICIMTLLMAHSIREYFNGRHHYAQGIVRLVPVGSTYDYNDLAGLIVCSLPFAWLFWREWTKPWQRALLLGHFALAAYCVLLTGSRMGFVGLVMLSVLACLASPKRWRLLSIYPVFLAVAWLVLPEDRRDRYFTLFDSSHGPKEASQSAGNLRYEGLKQALPLFAERPLIGFGPNTFGRATGKNKMPHNLYGQLLAELGTAGALTFGLILWGIAQNSFVAHQLTRNENDRARLLSWRTILATSASFLVLVVMAWGFNFLFWHVWLWFGGFQIVAMRCLEQQTAYDDPLSAAAWNDYPLSDQTAYPCNA